MLNRVIYHLRTKQWNVTSHNPYIWTCNPLFNRKNKEWCLMVFNYVYAFWIKKKICIRHVNNDRVSFVVTRDYEFHKTWLRVDELSWVKKNFKWKTTGVPGCALFLNWRKMIIKLSHQSFVKLVVMKNDDLLCQNLI